MKKKNKEYLTLTNFFSKALFLGIGISKILIDVRESTIFSLLIGTVMGTLILLFLNKLSYYNCKGIRKLIMFILIYTLLVIGLVEFTTLISSIYLIDIKKYMLMIPTLIVIIYMNSKDISIHYKISAMLYSVSLVIFLIALFSLTPQVDYLNLLPLFNVKFKKILFGGLEFSLFSVVPNILYGGLNVKKDNNIIKKYLVSNLLILLAFIVTQGILGIELIKMFKYPEYIVLKKISLLDFINNVENIISFFWLFTIFMYLTMCSKQLYDMSYKTFNNKYIYPIFLFISMFFIANYFLDNVNWLLFVFHYLWLILLTILIIYILNNLISLKEKNNYSDE